MKVHDRVGLYFVDGALRHIRYATPGESFRKDTGVGDSFHLIVISFDGNQEFKQVENYRAGEGSSLPQFYIEKGEAVIDETDRGIVSYVSFDKSWRSGPIFIDKVKRPERPKVTGANPRPEHSSV